MSQNLEPPPEGSVGGGPGSPAESSQGPSEPQPPSAFEAPPSPAIVDLAADIQAALPPDIVALKQALEERVREDATAALETAAVQRLDGHNIVGVGYGWAAPEAIATGLASNLAVGTVGLTVFTVEPVEMSRLTAEIAEVAGTRALSALPVVQVPVGVVEAFSHRFRARPAPGGISVGHFAITAGTLGCLAVGLRPPRTNRLLILSNNHVLANSNAAGIGDCICQPGPYDSGRCPADQIAILERFERIAFSGGVNYIDAATGWAWPDRVRRELVYLRSGTQAYFRLGGGVVEPRLGMIVGKTGRTTQLTQGRVTQIAVSVNVNFGGGRVAHFRDQFAIVGNSGPFSAGGDSGSVIWEWTTGLPAVGLLFAGGGGITIANRMSRVLAGLDIRLYV